LSTRKANDFLERRLIEGKCSAYQIAKLIKQWVSLLSPGSARALILVQLALEVNQKPDSAKSWPAAYSCLELIGSVAMLPNLEDQQ
jgi:hypothetical protein